jgi:hypothetical protein
LQEGIHPYSDFASFQEKSVFEGGSKISDDSSRLKIPEHDSWQNDELNTMDSHPGDDEKLPINLKHIVNWRSVVNYFGSSMT